MSSEAERRAAVTGPSTAVIQASPFWFEKISCLVFAAWLTSHGYRVGLSVPPHDVHRAGSGLDWEGKLRSTTGLGGDDLLTLDGRAHLARMVRSDPRLRYDGIWHDNPGRIDVVAWSRTETLIVEAKGALARGIPKEMMSAIGRIALQMTPARSDLAFGVLFPEDGERRTGFVGTLRREAVAESILASSSLRIYLVRHDGDIVERSLGDFATRTLAQVDPGPVSRAG